MMHHHHRVPHTIPPPAQLMQPHRTGQQLSNRNQRCISRPIACTPHTCPSSSSVEAILLCSSLRTPSLAPRTPTSPPTVDAAPSTAAAKRSNVLRPVLPGFSVPPPRVLKKLYRDAADSIEALTLLEELLVLRPLATCIACAGTTKDSAAATRQKATVIPDAVAMVERRAVRQLDLVDTFILLLCWAKMHAAESTGRARQPATCSTCVRVENSRQPFEKRLKNKYNSPGDPI